jgi:hypothetical protein
MVSMNGACLAEWDLFPGQPCQRPAGHEGMCRHDWDHEGRGFSWWGPGRRLPTLEAGAWEEPVSFF